MFASLLSLLALSCGGQETALEIVDPRATYGHLGALRPKLQGVLPGDVAFFTFGVKNLKLDAQSKAQYSVAIEVRDDKGNLVFEQKPFNSIAQSYFGGNLLPISTHMEVPLDAKPGLVTWKVTVHDRLADKKVTAQGFGKVLPAGFGLVRVGTFGDAEGKVPVPPIGVLGSHLFVHFAPVGFGRDAKTRHPHLKVELRVLDDKNQPISAKPLVGEVKEEIPEDVKFLPMQFALTLNRPGHFTVELNARCEITGATTQVKLPVRILPME